ncbi:uncharacterized protein LOC144654994 [Oculina patagonica]
MANSPSNSPAEGYKQTSLSVQKMEGIIFIQTDVCPQPGATILDLGCGTGELSAYLAELVGPEGKVVGVDPDRERILLAQQSHGEIKNLSFVEGSASNFPGIGLESYDIIFSNHVMHWIPDKEEVFKNMFESLKSGGKIAAQYGDHPHPFALNAFKELNPETAELLCEMVQWEERAKVEQYCSSAGFQIIKSYDTQSTQLVFESIPTAIKKKFPIKLFYLSAFSRDLIDYVVTHIGRGQSFLELAEDIASINFKTFVHNSEEGTDSKTSVYEKELYSFPSNDQLMHMFLSFFNNMEISYQNQMEAIPCSILTCDHTFKVSKHIGVARSSDNAFINQFENLFSALNEHGQVVAWRLTRSTAFKEVEDLLQDLKTSLDKRGQQLNMIMVDDCCAIRPSYRRVFPAVPVKLDIFHACQRFVKTIPKGSCHSQQISNEFGLIFRANGDLESCRKMETLDPETIDSNLHMFIKKWDYCLSEESKNAITNIKNHVRSGCCSGIPAGAGTQKNERL